MYVYVCVLPEEAVTYGDAMMTENTRNVSCQVMKVRRKKAASTF